MTREKLSKVRNRDTKPRDLADGRTLAPGADAEGVDMSEPHNVALAEDGVLIGVSDRAADGPSNAEQAERARAEAKAEGSGS